LGTNAPIIFPFSGVPAATAGAIPTQTFAITPTQVSWLFSGILYMNVHTSTFPGGEIRGQLTLTGVPEPSTMALTGLGAAALALRVWTKRRDRRT
jgi:CHRD domain-containing protein/PEP-CTERM motif-containing protein